MKKSKMGTLVIALPLGLGLSLALVACGGSSDSDNKNSGGASASGGSGGSASGGKATSSAGTSSSTGGSGKGGSPSQAGNTSSGGSASNPGGDLMTGLPEDKPLDSLSDAELGQLCDAIDNYFTSNLKSFSCAYAGLLSASFAQAKTDAAAQAACKLAYDACSTGQGEATTECEKPTGTCTATVGEFEACASDARAVFAEASKAIPSCADLTLADLMDTGSVDPSTLEEPESCKVMDAKCPTAPTPSVLP